MTSTLVRARFPGAVLEQPKPGQCTEEDRAPACSGKLVGKAQPGGGGADQDLEAEGRGRTGI